MKMPRIPLLLCGLAAALAMGACGDGQSTAPLSSSSSSRLLSPDIAKVPLVSEIVFCLDVSDSTSDQELQATVDGLLGCLGDESLIPTSGVVSVGVVVYADTSATLLSPLTPVTAQSLDGAIAPALEGLLTDRAVGTSGADLASGVRSSSDLLGEGSSVNRHVIVVGDGRADAPSEVTALCEDLATDGVLVSVLAVDAKSEGAELLADCAVATGGVFATVVDGDVESACAQALGFAAQANLMLEPSSTTAPKDTAVELMATVFRGADPQAHLLGSVAVIFTVSAGPNAGESDTTVTNETGQATFTLLGDGGVGTDEVTATVELESAAEPLQAMATIVWQNTPPTCDAGAAQEVLFVGDPVSFTLDGSASADADTSDVLDFSWSIGCESAEFDDAAAMMPVLTLDAECGCGVHTVSLTVSDGIDESSCETTVTLLDGTMPEIVPREEPLALWPPNHAMWEITPEMCLESVRDLCDGDLDLGDVVLLSVRSDEPVDAEGDGSTEPDVVVECDGTARLRAERAGGGNGRVYTLTYGVTDDAGNKTTIECRVTVPHDQRGADAVEDMDESYVVESDCD